MSRILFPIIFAIVQWSTYSWCTNYIILFDFIYYACWHANADEVYVMRLVDAVYARIIELVKERQITVNALANLSGVPRPTIVTMTRSATVKLSTVYGICDGLKITLREFFDSPLFDSENITD